jgi:hypothetical protein
MAKKKRFVTKGIGRVPKIGPAETVGTEETTILGKRVRCSLIRVPHPKTGVRTERVSCKIIG